ncbi:MAG: U32 family peptidase, partial [Bacteroidales bacterium]|nr:U32 family peptidase [Bacteroidales bacterium]
MKNIELLSPAKNLHCGIEAVKHGADAVYIGAPRFGARVAAGNSWEDLEKLVRFAHLYSAKVHVTLNTILTDAELEEARNMAWRCYEMGVDALIIQDMGLLRADLPPIALHASTQADNRMPEKVKFLQEVGFQRVILARELSLSQIKAIRQATEVELEAFVHGALCVSYSGQCYMSYAGCGRSANRGECAQYCRLPYTLRDAEGRVLQQERHLLSLKDMNRSGSLREMIEAGITSFKIEGRLKEADYVKNITLYYRRKLDALLEGKPEPDGKNGADNCSDAVWAKASAGKVTAFFEPHPEKSFNRGFTEYFLHGRRGDEHQWATPKSMGEPLGKVIGVTPKFFQLQTEKTLHNGDGLCFLDERRQLVGFRLNRVEANRLFPLEMPDGLQKGVMLYRNEDRLFSKQLEGETAVRKIAVSLLFGETEKGFSLTMTDEEGCRV